VGKNQIRLKKKIVLHFTRERQNIDEGFGWANFWTPRKARGKTGKESGFGVAKGEMEEKKGEMGLFR